MTSGPYQGAPVPVGNPLEPAPPGTAEFRLPVFDVQAAVLRGICPGCGAEIHPSGWDDFLAGEPCDSRLPGSPPPICGYVLEGAK